MAMRKLSIRDQMTQKLTTIGHHQGLSSFNLMEKDDFYSAFLPDTQLLPLKRYL